ncbi:helix-turn-helix domain-containing protein [Streptomyces scabiei]|uniref:helix-turn-helix domain-containing protein n=1 Tax=Streptomyces scabiei TaxID=1930 RepID=UPI0029AE0691|nr:helix-turn-helix domain-containing protein [Streptomyces scabiei]MDX3521208.1 helix-turn-helix domain-containing protein [Streptomyces scabiei]
MSTTAVRTVRLDWRGGHEQDEALLSATHLPWTVESRAEAPPPGLGDRVRVRSCELGRARLVDCTVAPVTARRGHREIARTEGEWIGVLLQLEGRSLIRHGDTAVESRPGSVTVWESTVPGRFAVTETERKRTILFPREVAAGLCPSLDFRSVIQLPEDQPAVRLFRTVAGEVADCAADLDEGARQAASRVLAELLAACLRPYRAVGRAALQAGLFANACAYIDRHIGASDLRPGTIAAALRVPLRTLQDVFAQRGETIWGYIKSLRLTRCRAELERGDGRTVTEIAFAFGFSSSGHFSRSFRERYGLTPREVRAAGAGKPVREQGG